MAVNVDVVAQYPDGKRIIAISHYFKMNGDMVADPDVTFLVCGSDVIPMAMQDSFRYSVGAEYDQESKLKTWPRVQAYITSFCNIWMRNIREQQFPDGLEVDCAS